MKGIQSLKFNSMVKLDLWEAYFSLPMYQNSGKYLRFACLEVEVFYQGPKVYHSFHRRMGVSIVIYLDNMRLLNLTSKMLLGDLTLLRWLLENLGFLINWKKSAIIPVHEILILDYLINSVEMMIMLPSDKDICIVEKCQRLVQ